jgi:predicted MFS family arabinose efflux permease
VLIYCCGVLAATSLGKMAPISVQMSAELHISLDQMALVISSTTAVAALVGLPTSYLIGRMAPKWALVGGSVLMAVAGFLGSRTTQFGWLMVTRLVESLGYVAVVVAAPVLIVAMGGGSRRTSALAVWGTFLPVGLALGSFGGGVLSTVVGWRGWLAIDAGVVLLVGLLAGSALGASTGTLDEPLPGSPVIGTVHAGLRRLARPLLLAVGLAVVSGTIVAVVSLFPTYLHEVHGVSTAAAGTLTGAVSLVGVIGGFLCGWLLNRGVPARRVFLATPLMPVGAAIAFIWAGPSVVAVLGAVLVALANELVIAAIFASTPQVVAVPSDIRLTNGLLAQVGSAGSLAGPPLAGFAVLTAGGWWAMAPTALVLCVIGTIVLRASVREIGRVNV